MEIIMNTYKEPIHPLIQEVVDQINSINDEVMKTHIGSTIAPYLLTDETHIGAILIGMGIGKLKYEDGEFSVHTDTPASIFWNGEKFEIIVREMPK